MYISGVALERGIIAGEEVMVFESMVVEGVWISLELPEVVATPVGVNVVSRLALVVRDELST